MTLTWDENVGAGTSLRGYLTGLPWSFTETVARLRALSGQDPATHCDGYKTSVKFAGRFDDQPFALYDYKGDYTLHVGGSGRLDVGQLTDALRAALVAVTPSAYEATVEYDEAAGERHGWPR